MIPVVSAPRLPPMSAEAVEKVRRLEEVTGRCPQVQVDTQHLLHAGVYARTIRLPAGVVLTGVLIKVATVVIVSGRCTVFVGDEAVELSGYNVLPGGAGRKQVFLTHTDTDLTMLFPTDAQSVDQAEAEFTDETDSLMSRQHTDQNQILITGE